MPPQVELKIEVFTRPKGEGAEAESAAPDAWPAKLVRRGLRPRAALALADMDTRRARPAPAAATRDDLDADDEWWRPSWIPFTSDGAGQAYCVDADTGAAVEYIHDDTHEPSARRLEGWLMRWAEELEAGEQVYDPGDEIVIAAWLLRD